MMSIDCLDLNKDILDIVGDYFKKDNLKEHCKTRTYVEG
jgi:hypothetical protein